MANQQTWGSFGEQEKDLVRSIFGEPRIDPAIPDGMVDLMEKAKTERMPVTEFLSRAERLALAKRLLEELHGSTR